ncbi:MAG: hypothetical protein P1P82_16955 [Bacteroidales bacterium]|nr:hypothetical protein [Bacteroidales bacterium]
MNGKNIESPVTGFSNEQFEMPKKLFVEDSDPVENTPVNGATGSSADLESIYNFLQDDYESKGYDDALANPDDSYKTDNIMMYKKDLEILIQKVTTKYDDLLREMDFHISSRQRAGLIDIVEELKSKSQTVSEHRNKVEEIENDAKNDRGMCQRMILSYQRGFNRGLAAITQSKFLNY